MVFGFTQKISEADLEDIQQKNKSKSSKALTRDADQPTRGAGAWTQLLTLMDNDPHFRYVTFDGMFWVDPFAGRLVYAPMNVRDAIVKHFRQHNHWKKGVLKPRRHLHTIVWLHYLKQHWPDDRRFLLFDTEGHWLNPLTKERHHSLTRALFLRDESRFRKHVAATMANEPSSEINSIDSISVMLDELHARGVHLFVDEDAKLHPSEELTFTEIGSDHLEVSWPATGASSSQEMSSTFFSEASAIIYPPVAEVHQDTHRHRLGTQSLQAPKASKLLSDPQPLSSLQVLDIQPLPLSAASDHALCLAWQQPVLDTDRYVEELTFLDKGLSPGTRAWMAAGNFTASHRLASIPEAMPLESVACYHPGPVERHHHDWFVEVLPSGHLIVATLFFPDAIRGHHASEACRGVIGQAALNDPRPQAIITALGEWAVQSKMIVHAAVGVVLSSPRSVHIQLATAGHAPVVMTTRKKALKTIGGVGGLPLGQRAREDEAQVHLGLLETGCTVIFPGHTFFNPPYDQRHEVLEEGSTMPLALLVPSVLEAGTIPGLAATDGSAVPAVAEEHMALFIRRGE